MLNLNRLQLLQELHRRGSLLAVSRALSFSPSTVSQQLKVLEKEVGAELTERVGRGLRLTREGEILAEHAARIFAEVERAEAAVAAVGAVAQGDVRVAALQTASLELLPRALQLLDRTDPHPRMLVSRIQPARALGALAAREFDVVLGEEYPGLPVSRQDGIELRRLVEDPMLLVVPEGYDGPLSAAEISARLPWVMSRPEATPARGASACAGISAWSPRCSSSRTICSCRCASSRPATPWRCCRGCCSRANDRDYGSSNCPGGPPATCSSRPARDPDPHPRSGPCWGRSTAPSMRANDTAFTEVREA